MCDISAQVKEVSEEAQACAMEELEDSSHLSASVDTGVTSPGSPVLMPLPRKSRAMIHSQLLSNEEEAASALLSLKHPETKTQTIARPQLWLPHPNIRRRLDIQQIPYGTAII